MRRSVLLLALLSLANAAAEPPIRLQIRTRIAQAPASIHAKVILERHPANRVLVIQVESPGYSTREDRQLDGDAAVRVHDFWWKDLPCGAYDVRAVVSRSTGEQKHAAEHFNVVDGDCGSPFRGLEESIE